MQSDGRSYGHEGGRGQLVVVLVPVLVLALALDKCRQVRSAWAAGHSVISCCCCG